MNIRAILLEIPGDITEERMEEGATVVPPFDDIKIFSQAGNDLVRFDSLRGIGEHHAQPAGTMDALLEVLILPANSVTRRQKREQRICSLQLSCGPLESCRSDVLVEHKIAARLEGPVNVRIQRFYRRKMM
ncbi:MAG: hypothetical protein XD72_2070 [Methanothrix harundinacea]|uniref:Uncharacterized protein n=1 Tax=Methanothrix harundinacea TaxID=301375 RepID=A0A101FSJ2_9EURY|nr:MAG: hypothetical protein XD72_2070 [Methanothrix harundinacea]